jgi:hypothetical protein
MKAIIPFIPLTTDLKTQPRGISELGCLVTLGQGAPGLTGIQFGAEPELGRFGEHKLLLGGQG